MPTERPIIGIDPGVTGAVAILRGDDLLLFDAPVDAIRRGGKERRVLNPMRMASVLRVYAAGASVAYIEQVAAHAVHGRTQGASSMFNFGRGYGLWLGILAACDIPFVEVPASVWKPPMVGRGADKAASRYRAAQLFPECSDEFDRVKDDGRAEAALIAWFGRHQETRRRP